MCTIVETQTVILRSVHFMYIIVQRKKTRTHIYEQDLQSTFPTHFIYVSAATSLLPGTDILIGQMEENKKIRHFSKRQSRIGNLRAMPRSPCHPAFLRDPSHSCSECQPSRQHPRPLLGGLTRIRPSALGCRARLTPIHSSSRSSRQVFPQDVPRWFPGGSRGKPGLSKGKTSAGCFSKGGLSPKCLPPAQEEIRTHNSPAIHAG